MKKKDEKREIKVEYTDDNGEKYERWVSLEELCVMVNNWADAGKKLPKDLHLEIRPLSSSSFLFKSKISLPKLLLLFIKKIVF